MTLTVDLAELRTANEKALAALSRTSKERFDTELAEIENFLLSLYRFAVLAVRNEQEIERAAEVWRETLDVLMFVKVVHFLGDGISPRTAGQCRQCFF